MLEGITPPGLCLWLEAFLGGFITWAHSLQLIESPAGAGPSTRKDSALAPQVLAELSSDFLARLPLLQAESAS